MCKLVFLQLVILQSTRKEVVELPLSAIANLGGGEDKRSIKFDILPIEVKVKLRDLASSFNSLFSALQAKEEIFTVGSMSRILGEQLEAMQSARNRRKNPNFDRKISLILIDRTLDFAGPSSLAFEGSFLDKIRECLLTFPGHANDVQIEMGPLFGLGDDSAESGTFCGGNLADSGSETSEDVTLRDLYSKKEEVIVDELNDALKKALKQAGKEIPKNGDKIQSFEALIQGFENDEALISSNLDLVQRSRAVLLTLRGKRSRQLDGEIAKIRQLLRNNLGNKKDLQECLPHLTKLLRSRGKSETDLSLEDFLTLLTFLYSVINHGVEFFEEDEDRLQSVLSEVIVRECEKPDHLSDLGATLSALRDDIGLGKMDELVAHKIVKRIFSRLKVRAI